MRTLMSELCSRCNIFSTAGCHMLSCCRRRVVVFSHQIDDETDRNTKAFR